MAKNKSNVMKQSKVIPIHNYHDKLNIICQLEECKGPSLMHYYIRREIESPENTTRLIEELKSDCETNTEIMKSLLGEKLVSSLLKYTP